MIGVKVRQQHEVDAADCNAHLEEAHRRASPCIDQDLLCPGFDQCRRAKSERVGLWCAAAEQRQLECRTHGDASTAPA